LLIAGTDVYYVSRMLGHASIQLTVDTYGRWLPANRKGALDVLDAPGREAARGRDERRGAVLSRPLPCAGRAAIVNWKIPANR